MNMQDALVPDDLWEVIEPLLPPPKPRKNNAGRPPVPDRACLRGVIYVLRTGCQWRFLPCRELDCGSYPTVWRRFALWTRAGVWPKLHQALVDWGVAIGEVDPKHVIIDTASFRAVFGGRTPDATAQTVVKRAASGWS
jgi:transposase